MTLTRILRASLIVLPTLFAVGCEDETSTSPADTGIIAAEAGAGTADGGSSDAATSDAAASDDGAAGAETGPAADASGTTLAALGVVVVHTDYKTTNVSLVNPATGTLIRDNCISSGSKPPQLTTALSGDVVPPSQVQPDNEIVLIDRQNATLTWVAPRTCEVRRQLNVGEGKMANPQDVITVSATKAYVPRYASSASDLLVINPSTATITGHVDLKPHTPRAAGDKAVSPTATRGVFARGKIYVVLNNLSDDFKYAAAGRVVVVDPATDTVTSTIDLPTLQNCASVALVDAALVVACGGVYGDPGQTAASGVAWIDLAATPPTVKVVPAAGFGGALSPFDVAALSSSLGFAIVGGDFSGTPPDRLWAFDFAGGAPRKVLDGKAAFTFSGLLVDPASKKLVIADAAPGAPKLHFLDLANPAAPAVQSSLTSSASGLPPKYLSWY